MGIQYSDDGSQFDRVRFDLAGVRHLFQYLRTCFGAMGLYLASWQRNQHKRGNNRQKWELNILMMDLNLIGLDLI